MKVDCAKSTGEVCSDFCNIDSGISLKRQKRHQKAKNCFFWCLFFMFRLAKGGKTRTTFDRIYLYNGLECGKVENPNTFLPELYCTVRNLEERFFKEAAERITRDCRK